MDELLSALRAYSKKNLYPMHMPGHKRDPAFVGLGEPFELDFTEVEGLDELYAPGGILKDAMARAAALYGSEQALYLVGGSTSGVLAGVLAAVSPGSAVVVARNCHRSVYAAMELHDLEPIYLYPGEDASFGVAGSIKPEAVAVALDGRPDAQLVVLTSPTYDGVVSDIRGIVAAAHARGVPVLVDAAHGAHLGFSPAFPEGVARSGADLVVMSLHKTLPALTQCALLHVRGNLVDPSEVWRRLAMVQTSSPSYPLMASIDRCVGLMHEQGAALMEAHAARLSRFSKRVEDLRWLRVMRAGTDADMPHPEVYDFDRSRLVISVRGTSLTGPTLAAALRETYRIETEMALSDYALALTSPCDTDEGLSRLADALLNLDRSAATSSAAAERLSNLIAPPIVSMSISHATAASWEEVSLERAIGRVAAEYAWAYPPGIPLITPGEVVGKDFVATSEGMCMRGVALRRSTGGPNHLLRVLDHK